MKTKKCTARPERLASHPRCFQQGWPHSRSPGTKCPALPLGHGKNQLLPWAGRPPLLACPCPHGLSLLPTRLPRLRDHKPLSPPPTVPPKDVRHHVLTPRRKDPSRLSRDRGHRAPTPALQTDPQPCSAVRERPAENRNLPLIHTGKSRRILAISLVLTF